MTKSVATRLAVFAGLMFIVFGLKTGLSEHYLEPTGLTENVYSSESQPQGMSVPSTDIDLLSCGSAWLPYEGASYSDERSEAKSDSRLSYFGKSRCEAVLSGTDWTAVLLTLSGVGIWSIMLIGFYDRRRTARIQAEDAEMDRLVAQKRAQSERRRREIADRSAATRAESTTNEQRLHVPVETTE